LAIAHYNVQLMVMFKLRRSSFPLSLKRFLLFITLFVFIGIYLVVSSSAQVSCSMNISQGDLNCDNEITISDLSYLLTRWSTNDATADINKDGQINITDLSIMLSHYGTKIASAIGSIGTPGNFAETPIPSNVKIDPLSAAVAGELAAQAANNTWINIDSYTPQIYTVPTDQPLVPVQLCRFEGNCVPSWAQGIADTMAAGVPVPKDANGQYVYGAPGTDKEIVIWQPDYVYGNHTGRLWELWQFDANPSFNSAQPVSSTNSPLMAAWGGRVSGTKNYYGPSHFFDNWWWDPYANVTGPDNTGQAKEWGVTAAATWMINDVVRNDDCQAQTLSHSIGLEVEYTNWQTARWPAQRSDGTDSAKTVGQGMRLFLPANTLEPAGMTRYEKMIFNGLKKYGSVVDDTAYSWNRGGGVFVRTQLGSAVCKELMDGQGYDRQLDNIPWNQLKLIVTGSDENPNPTD
jgi:hypothetical protein